MWVKSGFTVVELIVVMTIIAILTSISVYLPTQLLPLSRDTERTNDTEALTRRLEQAYTAQDVGAPAYPTTTKLLADIASTSSPGTVARLDRETLKAPGASSPSVVAATSNSTSAPKGAGSPVAAEYVYQPLNAAGALCTGTDTCIRFNLYYRLEKTNTVVMIKSIHQQ